MRLLLDTHVVLALLELGSVALPKPLINALSNKDVELQVSAASLWEIAIKVRSGKLGIGMDLSALPDACASAGVTVFAIEPLHVLAELNPEPPTRDPFDRLLLAQASVESMQLVTLDRALRTHPLAWTPSA